MLVVAQNILKVTHVRTMSIQIYLLLNVVIYTLDTDCI